MKKINIMILLIAIVALATFYGCIDSGVTSKSVSGNKVLVDNHTGWGSVQCFSCHDVVTITSTEALSIQHSALVANQPEKLDTSVCLACHGTNGVPDAVITGCSNCHSETSTIAVALNQRYLAIHANDNLSSANVGYLTNDKNCVICHNVNGHPGITTLDIKSESCLNCHQNYETPEVHKGIADCRACHSTVNFVRDNNVIIGHNAPVDLAGSNCLQCHNSSTPLPTNTRFVSSHKTTEALTVSNCLTCHNITTGHFDKASALRVIADPRCLYCHADSATLTHFNDPTCSTCHGVRGFMRDVATQEISGHNTDSTFCMNCHSASGGNFVPRYSITHTTTDITDKANCIQCHNMNASGHFQKSTLLKTIISPSCLTHCHNNIPMGPTHILIGGYGMCANSNCHVITGYVRDSSGAITKHNSSLR